MKISISINEEILNFDTKDNNVNAIVTLDNEHIVFEKIIKNIDCSTKLSNQHIKNFYIKKGGTK